MFSPNEEKILKIVGRRKSITITELTEKFYGTSELSMNAGIIVASAVRNINRKCKHHKLDWFLNSVGTGRTGKTVWLDKQ